MAGVLGLLLGLLLVLCELELLLRLLLLLLLERGLELGLELGLCELELGLLPGLGLLLRLLRFWMLLFSTALKN